MASVLPRLNSHLGSAFGDDQLDETSQKVNYEETRKTLIKTLLTKREKLRTTHLRKRQLKLLKKQTERQ